MAESKPKPRGWKKPEGHGEGRGTESFRTAGGSVSANGRREAESHGDSMPGGRFPIRNKRDLENAKRDFGRAKDKAAVRTWINKRAKELGEPPLGGSKPKPKRPPREAVYDHPRSAAIRKENARG